MLMLIEIKGWMETKRKTYKKLQDLEAAMLPEWQRSLRISVGVSYNEYSEPLECFDRLCLGNDYLFESILAGCST